MKLTLGLVLVAGFADWHWGGKTVRGISLYGIGPELQDWFVPWPKHWSWRDVWDDGAEVNSEFAVPQKLAPAVAVYREAGGGPAFGSEAGALSAFPLPLLATGGPNFQNP
jgi:hypothetical protein